MVTKLIQLVSYGTPAEMYVMKWYQLVKEVNLGLCRKCKAQERRRTKRTVIHAQTHKVDSSRRTTHQEVPRQQFVRMAWASLHVWPFKLEVVHKITFIYQQKRVKFIAALLGYPGANDSLCKHVSSVFSCEWYR